jgi:hypothetical protein
MRAFTPNNRQSSICISTILNTMKAIIKYMCNVIDDYREDELSEAWIKIERRKLVYS